MRPSAYLIPRIVGEPPVATDTCGFNPLHLYGLEALECLALIEEIRRSVDEFMARLEATGIRLNVAIRQPGAPPKLSVIDANLGKITAGVLK
jgi:hypothetical protein